jgi:hypothetical protein
MVNNRAHSFNRQIPWAMMTQMTATMAGTGHITLPLATAKIHNPANMRKNPVKKMTTIGRIGRSFTPYP